MTVLDDAIALRIAEGWGDYTLIDTGDGQKLEDFGEMRLIRPEAQAMWPKAAPRDWSAANARFEGTDDDDGPGRWSATYDDFPVRISNITMICRQGQNHHVGLFPEQRPHWEAAEEALDGTNAPEVLNLFGYTGAASLYLASRGARVTHVDASKKAIAWARENQAASGLDDAPIRWICDDASKFVAREVRRGRRYQAILLDPPKFGRGPKNEVWNLYESLPPLLAGVAELVAEDARIVTLTAYAIRASALAFGRTLAGAMERHGGRVETGELAVREIGEGHLLPTSMYAEWRP